ncbi:hypothetical protein CR513_00861, partial [Mucuna pruriens]
MTPEISQNYMFYSFVYEIWQNLTETYSIEKDFVACYDIESKIFNSRHLSNRIELDQYQGLKMCKTDSIAYIEFVEKGRIFKFFHGLNSEYNTIRVQILGKEKLPSLSEVFSTVQGEETQRLVMLDKGSSNTGSATMIEKCSTKGSTSKGKPSTKSSYGE